MTLKLALVKSPAPLYILHLSSGRAQVYLASAKGAKLIDLSLQADQTEDLLHFAARTPDIAWAILVDQSEETFWGGVMPMLRGAAKTAWIERMAAQSGSESPYRWSDLQGKSRSQPDKLRVLGYTLGRPESLTPLLEALQSANARIRGVYSPVMLTATALGLLKIKASKGKHDIGVLVTPHAEGIRQSVLVEGHVRFSRLALHPHTSDAQWFATVYNETARLREYLTSNGLLQNDRAGMQLYVVLPPDVDPTAVKSVAVQHPRDQYSWLESPLADLVYVAALAKSQPLAHLAPAFYSQRDLSARITRSLYVASGILGSAFLVYAALALSQLWQKQQDSDAATAASNAALKQYAAIAKNFPPTPLTAQQLMEMSKRWDAIKTQMSPPLRELLIAAGHILDKHPNLVIDAMEWTSDIPSKPASPLASKDKKEVASLLLTGSIHGIRSDDLRGTRDALAKLLLDFNQSSNIRAEVIKNPLDLSSKASLSGPGKQASSELSFEIKLWQR